MPLDYTNSISCKGWHKTAIAISAWDTKSIDRYHDMKRWLDKNTEKMCQLRCAHDSNFLPTWVYFQSKTDLVAYNLTWK